MKKIITIVLTVSILFSSFLTSCKTEDASIPESPVTDFEYEENADGGITITKYIGADVAVSIPQKINAKNVTELGERAFSYSYQLKKIQIPDTVIVIEMAAFWHLQQLEKVILSNNLKEIGNGAFESCEMLSQISLSPSLTDIGNSAFKGCKSLKSVTIPKSVTSWGIDAFANCGLERISFEEGLEFIGEAAFFNTAITKVNFPSSIKTIKRSAFAGCGSLKEVELNDGLLTVECFAFGGKSELSEITIPSTVTEITEDAFEQCVTLKSVKFEGDAPKDYAHQGDMREYMLYADYTVYYHNEAQGFTSPKWCGYNTEIW